MFTDDIGDVVFLKFKIPDMSSKWLFILQHKYDAKLDPDFVSIEHSTS